MNSPDQIQFLLSAFALYIPILVVCITAGVVALTKWQKAPDAAMWALIGFGLALILCFTTPIGQMLIQRWVTEGQNPQTRFWAFTVFGFVNALLHAAIYLMLLVAIFIGRPSSVSENGSAHDSGIPRK